MDRILLRPAEVADALGIGRSKAYDLIAKGLLPSVRIGGLMRVSVESLERWVSEQAMARPTQPDQAAEQQADS